MEEVEAEEKKYETEKSEELRERRPAYYGGVELQEKGDFIGTGVLG